MKKILLGICSLAFVSCLTAGVALNAPVEVANAETSIFTETKVQVSNEGNKMLVVTGITDVDVVYELGYKVNGQAYVAGAGETAETTKYYESLTLGSVTKTASEFIAGAEGLLIWEIAYDNTQSYSVQPYALVGEKQGDVLVAPEVEVPTYGTAKENFNVFTVTFVDEDGEEIDAVEVNYGATVNSITAPEKENYSFDGWYLNGAKYDFTSKVTSDLTLTAKYKAPAKYTVEVKVAEYAKEDISGGYRVLGTKTYVDKTSEYASVFGLDENGQSQGEVDSFVDLTSKIDTLKGAKLNKTASTVNGVIAEDGSLTLTVCLDFDEEELGFKLSDVTLGIWQLESVTFTLKYFDGVCGLAIDCPLTGGWGKQIEIKFDELVVNDYSTVKLNYYEYSPKNPSVYIFDGEGTLGEEKKITEKTMVNDYGKYVIDFMSLATTDTITGVKIKIGRSNTDSWNCFIPAIEKKAYLKENVTYSVANGNIMDIATPLNGVELTTKSYNFDTFSDEKEALYYNYSGEEIIGDHKLGIIFDINVKVSDYKSIKIVYRAFNANGNGTAFWMNGTAYPDNYLGSAGGYFQTIDLIALANSKGMTTISTFELQVSASKVAMTTAELYIASIVFELA